MPKNKQSNFPKNGTRRHRPLYKHPVFIFLIIIILAVVAVFATQHFTKQPATTSSSTVNLSSSTNSPQVSSVTVSPKSDSSEELPASETGSSVSPDGKTPAKYEGTNSNNSDTLTGNLTTARFDGDKLIIRINIDQYLTSGYCTLTLSDAANQLTKSANLIPSASTSTCEGFDIAASELTNFSRPITINIDITSNEKTGVITGVVNE